VNNVFSHPGRLARTSSTTMGSRWAARSGFQSGAWKNKLSSSWTTWQPSAAILIRHELDAAHRGHAHRGFQRHSRQDYDPLTGNADGTGRTQFPNI